MFFSLKNNSAQVVESGLAPWDCASQRPEFETKEEFRTWCKRPSTRHYFYSLYEGVNAAARINKENPPFRMHGLVVDYDADLSDIDILATIKRNIPHEFLPTWFSRTFSGGARVVWLFEEPSYTYNITALKALLARLKKEFKLKKLLNGLDEEVLTNPMQYYELGTDWTKVSEVLIPSTTLRLWIYEAGNKVKWSGEGVEIPIEVVRAEVEKQYPGRWEGDFDLGARGVRFWDPTADDPTAAVVRSTGMTCFTGDKPFVSWSEIFGAAFTRQFQERRVELATDNIWYDGRHFWRRRANGCWTAEATDKLALHMRSKVKLCPDRIKTNSSEVDDAIYHIVDNNYVTAAIPFVHRKPGLHRLPDGVYLNTSNVSVCQPVEDPVDWGDGFPWIAKFLDGYFSSPEQLDFFLAWLQRFYQTAYEQHMERGQAVFIAGPVGMGKTLLSNRIVGGMVGGASDVTSYMLGESSWNSASFERALWNIDDTGPGKDPRTHTVYSNNIKKHVANQEFDFQKKFHDAARVHWTGRIIVTLNNDEESLGMLPELDISIMDKVMFFRTADRQHEFPVNVEAIIQAELPFFCRWLLDWEPPTATQGGTRFGVKEYHESGLLQSAKERGQAHEFQEILETFMVQWTREHPDEKEWVGFAAQLFAEMAMTDTTKELVRRMTTRSLGKSMRALASREPEMVQARVLHGRSLWVISAEFVE